MSLEDRADRVVRRVVVEYGFQYVYAYICDDNGKILEEERFKQPFRLDKKDAHEEAMDCFQNSYQWVLDTCVFSARGGDDSSESKQA